MLAKAAGGSSVPKFIKDTGNEQLIGAFKFLGSDQMTGPGSELLFVEKYGETLYREAGFTETAEKINGRLAQVGFVLAVQNTFNGDVLTLIAKYPLLVALVTAGIAGAISRPRRQPPGLLPRGSQGYRHEGVRGRQPRRCLLREGGDHQRTRRHARHGHLPPHRHHLLNVCMILLACVTRRIDRGTKDPRGVRAPLRRERQALFALKSFFLVGYAPRCRRVA